MSAEPLKRDEREFLKRVVSQVSAALVLRSDNCPVPVKRGYYLLDKWTRKGFWEYGVTSRTGWFTQAGKDWLEDLGLIRQDANTRTEASDE